MFNAVTASAAINDGFSILPNLIGGSYTTTPVPIGQKFTAPPVSFTFQTGGSDQIDQLILPPGFTNKGTCVPGFIAGNNSTCTVILEYIPTSQNQVSGPVQVSCSPAQQLGGAIITCNGVLQSVFTLIGVTAALTSAVQNIPVGGPWMISLMSLALLGIGMFSALRRKS